MLNKSKLSSVDRAKVVFARNLDGNQFGLIAVCSAHPLVLRAALRSAQEAGQIALIEATCNQVNQDGGYTGMRPVDFVARVLSAASDVGFSTDMILLGGDHLGPQPWRDLPAEVAMDKAATMVAEYVRAGFQKIHLDCSMRCADDPEVLTEAVCAARAAKLAESAEAAVAPSAERPIYVIGTEVPPPGGMGAGHKVVPTDPSQVGVTWTAHETAFAKLDLHDAFSRVCGIVVQPGLDFGNETVEHFVPSAAKGLSRKAGSLHGAVFEAHSTDYQCPTVYPALVGGHFAILKVGPALTFALREAIYALDMLANEIWADKAPNVRGALETEMLSNPVYWHDHYNGDEVHQTWLRHFSWSDRIRYYWTTPAVETVVADMFKQLDATVWPLPILSQYLPLDAAKIADGELAQNCADIVINHVRRALAPYFAASHSHLILGEDH